MWKVRAFSKIKYVLFSLHEFRDIIVLRIKIFIQFPWALGCKIYDVSSNSLYSYLIHA